MNQSLIDNLIFKANKKHNEKNFLDAEKLYKQVLSIEPKNVNCLNYLGTLFAQTNRKRNAEEVFLKAINFEPNNPVINNNLGNIYHENGNYDKAIAYYKKTILFKPGFVPANLNLGIIYYKKGKFMDALNFLKKVIQVQPNNIKCYSIIATIYKHLQNFKETLNCYKKIFELDPDNHMALSGTIDLFNTLNLINLSKSNSHELLGIFIFLYKKNNINHNYLFNNAKNLIIFDENKTELEEAINKNSNIIDKNIVKIILNKEILHLMLQKSLVRDKFLENFLCKIRREILFAYVNENKSQITEFYDFILSLAQQSFLNEYIFSQTKEEIETVNKLKFKIENSVEINELEISIIACYLPLVEFNIITDKLSNYYSKKNLFNEVVKVQIKDFMEEQDLKRTIKSDEILDQTSKKVRGQYEENPYPRWRYAEIHPKVNFLNEINSDIYPNEITFNDDIKIPKILIAGCGTGQQLARRINYIDSKVLAIDLSLSSLAFAKRKMQEFKINNIEFLHIDLLKLKKLKRKFNIIECIGVLHHLDDPEQGLNILLDTLETNGFLKLGLYSKLARQHIVEARKFINKNKFTDDIAGLRNFRELAKNNKDNISLQKLNDNYDFHTTSSLRDLVFHVQEHQFSLSKISRILKKYNLEFLGFTSKSIKKDYAKFYKNDQKNLSLKNWHEFETNYPNIFQSMYQFWVKKN